MAVFDEIETLKKKYTDKFVLVDESQPELRRFRGLTGTVKTVNMSGRALVEFDGNNNIGWYDIELTHLKVVDQPLPKPEKEAGKKEAGKKEPAAAAKAEKAPAAATPKPAAKPAAGGGKSMAEILAAARGGAKAAPGVAAKAEASPVEAKPAAAQPVSAPAAKLDPKKMSMAEILAAARGKAGAAPAAAPPAAKAPVEKTAPEVAPVETPAPEAPIAKADAAPPQAAEVPAPSGGEGKKSMKDAFKTPAEIVAYLRKAGAK